MSKLGKRLIKAMEEALAWQRDDLRVHYYFESGGTIPDDGCHVVFTLKNSVPDVYDALRILAGEVPRAMGRTSPIHLGVLKVPDRLCFAYVYDPQHVERLLEAIKSHPDVRDASCPRFLQEKDA